MRRAAIAIGLTLLTSQVHAHSLAPALLDLDASDPGGRVAVLWKMPAVRTVGGTLRPLLPEQCPVVATSPAEPVDGGAALATRLTLDCGAGGLASRVVGVAGLDATGTNALVVVHWPDGVLTQELLGPDHASTRLEDTTSAIPVMGRYLALGVRHLLTGWDHLLLVLGLVLLIRGRRVIGAVTAFTVGHSVTLALASLGVLALGGPWVEVGIAASIVLAADEAWRGGGAIARRPWLVCGALGLLHGLGFAGALREVGLPDGQIPLALFSFNVGIELAQLSVIGLALGLGAALRHLPERLVAPAPRAAAFVIGAVGCYAVLARIVQA